MRKGISPLIAAVLLIAFTLAVAGLAGPFLTQVTQKAQGDTRDKTSTITDSTDMQLEVMSVDFDSTTGEYTVNIRNAGTSKAENLTLTIQGDNPVQKQIDGKIESGEIYTATISSSHSTKSEKLIAESRNYPVKTDYDLANADTVTNSISWKKKSDWDAAAAENSVVHENTSNTSYDNASKVQLGYSPSSPLYESSLSAYYPIQEESDSTVYDFGGSNDGTTNGDISKGNSGLLGTKTYSFDGTDDEVSLSSTDYGTAHTVSHWIHKTSTDGQVSIGGPNTNNGDNYVWWDESTDTGYRYKSDGSVGSTSGSAIFDSNWHHVVFARSGGSVEVYIDGVNEGTISVSDSRDLTISGIGYTPYASTDQYGWTGKITEVRIYDQQLSSDQVDSLYNVDSGYLESDIKSSSNPIKPDLETSATLNGKTIEVDVIGSPDTGSEESHTVSLDGSGSHSISWTSSHTDFKINASLSTTDLSATPVLKKVELKPSS